VVHEELWQQLLGLERKGTTQRAKCQYLTDPERYVITFLNTKYVINLSDRQIFSVQPDSAQVPTEFLEQLCLFAYLIHAQDLPLAGKFVGPAGLRGGQFFFRGPHSLPTEKLEKAFGDCPEGLYNAMQRFNAERREFGNASIELCVLPRVPLTLVVWRKDEEFDARASILFDQTAAAHLPLDALLTAVNLAVDAVIEAWRQNS